MGMHLQSRISSSAKKILKKQSLLGGRNGSSDVPKGHIAVYVGDLQKKRFVVPIPYINHPSFLHLFNHAEEEFGFEYPMGGLTIPCREYCFIDLTSRLHP